MANIGAYNGISSGDAPLATVVSGNFDKISAAINNNAINSDNYGVSSILSQHISTNAILSQHISNNAIVAAKITDNAIVHSKIQFGSANNGARVLQVGAASSDMPANGVIFARMSQTMSLDSVSTGVQTFVFSDATPLDGAAGFTADPQLGQPMFQVAASTDSAPVACNLTALNSASAVFSYVWSVTQDITLTANVVAAGPK